MEGSATISRAPEAADDGETVDIALDELHTLTQAALAAFGYSDDDAAAIAEVIAYCWQTVLSVICLSNDRGQHALDHKPTEVRGHGAVLPLSSSTKPCRWS